MKKQHTTKLVAMLLSISLLIGCGAALVSSVYAETGIDEELLALARPDLKGATVKLTDVLEEQDLRFNAYFAEMIQKNYEILSYGFLMKPTADLAGGELTVDTEGAAHKETVISNGSTSAKPQITENDIQVSCPSGERTLDLTGITPTIYYCANFEGNETRWQFWHSYENGVLTYATDSGEIRGWVQRYAPAKYVLDFQLNETITNYQYESRYAPGAQAPLFVLDDGTVCGLLFESETNNDRIYYVSYDTNGNRVVRGLWSNGVDFNDLPERITQRDKVTYAVTFSEDLKSVSFTVTDENGTVLHSAENKSIDDFVAGKEEAKIDPTHIAVGYTFPIELSMNESRTVAVQTVIEGKEPLLNFINSHPILIEIANGKLTSEKQYLANKANAQKALDSFASLDATLQDLLKQTPYYSTDVEAKLNTIANMVATQLVTDTDIDATYTGLMPVDLTGITPTIYYCANFEGNETRWQFWHSYENGVLTYATDSGEIRGWVQRYAPAKYVLDFQLNETITNYQYESRYAPGAQAPLFVLDDGTVCGLLFESETNNDRIYYVSYDTNGNRVVRGLWSNGVDFNDLPERITQRDKVTYAVTFSEDLKSVSFTVTDENGTVLHSAKNKSIDDFVAGKEEAKIDPTHMAVGYTFPIELSMNESRTVAVQTHKETKEPILDFINENPILVEIVGGEIVSGEDYAANREYARLALENFAALNPELQKAVKNTAYYSSDVVSLLEWIASGATAPMQSITQEDISTWYPEAKPLDLTGTEAIVKYMTNAGGNETKWQYWHSYEDGVFTYSTDSSIRDWVQWYTPAKYALDIQLNGAVSNYQYKTSYGLDVQVPLFVLSDGTICGLRIDLDADSGNGRICYVSFNDEASAITRDKWEPGYDFDLMNGYPDSLEDVTYAVTFGEGLKSVSYTITDAEGNVLYSRNNMPIDCFVSNENGEKTIANDHAAVGFSFDIEESMNEVCPIVLETVELTKTPIVNFVNENPVLIDIAGGKIVSDADYRNNGENAQKALDRFEALDAKLQAALQQTPYFSTEVVDMLLEILEHTTMPEKFCYSTNEAGLTDGFADAAVQDKSFTARAYVVYRNVNTGAEYVAYSDPLTRSFTQVVGNIASAIVDKTEDDPDWGWIISSTKTENGAISVNTALDDMTVTKDIIEAAIVANGADEKKLLLQFMLYNRFAIV